MITTTQHTLERERFEALIEDLGALVLSARVIPVTRPDGQLGYKPAPPLPCPHCSGSGVMLDVELELEGLCPECGGTGEEAY